MASAAPRKIVKKALLQEEMVQGVLESDEDESLSEFIEHPEHLSQLSYHLPNIITLASIFVTYISIYRLNLKNLKLKFDFWYFWLIFFKNCLKIQKKKNLLKIPNPGAC